MTTGTGTIIKSVSLTYHRVKDIQRSLAFYRDVLGLDIQQSPEYPTWVQTMNLPGSQLGLEQTEDPSSIKPGTTVLVFNCDDVKGAAESLRARGQKVEGPRTEPYGIFADVFDPDGYMVQLFQDTSQAS
jgi:lactoylglutathione lyase